jgi:hypothetical protein
MIEQENKRFGVFSKNGVTIKNSDGRLLSKEKQSALLKKFWQWMGDNSTTLRRLHVLGGEPLFQDEFERCLVFLETHRNPELEFNVVTNLKISLERLEKIVGRIKALVANRQIKRFDITASIDCFGSEQEYVRYGLNLEQWRENFAYLAKQKWIYLSINQTLSGLTIKTIPDLLKFVNGFRNEREIGHHLSTTVFTYDFLHPKIFGSGFWDQDFDQILH